MNKEKRRERVKLINKTFERLSWACEVDSDSHHYFDKYYALCRSEEKSHRGMNFGGVPDGLTVTEAAKLYACFDVFRWLLVDKTTPCLKDYLWTRKGLFTGYAMLHHFAHSIHKEFSTAEILEFCQTCDYVSLNQDPATDGTRLDNDKTGKEAA